MKAAGAGGAGAAGTSLGRERDPRRALRRYKMTAPVQFRWKEHDAWREGYGVTRDISVGGVFIRCSLEVPLDAPIEIKMTVPKFFANMTAKQFLQGTGIITRVNPDEGFAAQVNFELWRVDAKGVASSLR